MERHEAEVDTMTIRTFRRVDKPRAPIPDSLAFAPNMQVEWQRRSENLARFIQAARKVFTVLTTCLTPLSSSHHFEQLFLTCRVAINAVFCGCDGVMLLLLLLFFFVL